MEIEVKYNTDDVLVRAAECWSNGQALEAGKLIYEAMPTKSRPKWAAQILKVVLDKSGIRSAIFNPVLAAADHESRWKSGHQVFSTLRDSVLKFDDKRRQSGLSDDEELLVSILSLAELVAKVTYNATNPPDEFDEDSGWWIAACLRGFLDHDWSDEDFVQKAWTALCYSE